MESRNVRRLLKGVQVGVVDYQINKGLGVFFLFQKDLFSGSIMGRHGLFGIVKIHHSASTVIAVTGIAGPLKIEIFAKIDQVTLGALEKTGNTHRADDGRGVGVGLTYGSNDDPAGHIEMTSSTHGSTEILVDPWFLGYELHLSLMARFHIYGTQVQGRYIKLVKDIGALQF